MNAAVIARDVNNLFRPQAPSSGCQGNVVATSEAFDWPGLLVKSVDKAPGEGLAPPTSDNGICLTLSGSGAKVQRRLSGGPLEESCSERGQAYITPAGREAWWKSGGHSRILMISIRDSLLGRVMREVFGMDTANAELEPRFGFRDAKLEHMGRLLLNEIEMPQSGGRLFVESLANALAVHLLRNQVPAPARVEESRFKPALPAGKLKRVVDYIEAHLDDGLSLQQISELTDYSAYHFSRLFKQATRLSPHQYVLERRIQRASELLKASNASAADIALTVGFSSQSHLVSAFKKIMGVTPRAYRNR